MAIVFSFFKKKSQYPSLKDDPVGYYLAIWTDDIASCRRAIPKNYEQESYEYVARNSDSAIRRIIIQHALLLRCRKDTDAATSELTAANEFLDHIENATAKAEAKGLILPPNKEGVHETCFIHLSNLLFAFIVLLLSKDWPRAERFANLLDSSIMQDASTGNKDSVFGDSHFDLIVMMFAAVILDNPDEFKALQKRYHHGIIDKDYFYEKYFNYDQMMASIINKDEAGFNASLPAQEQNYLSRKSDKKLEGANDVFGAYNHNDFIYDVVATALCNLAIHKGFSVKFSSEVIPVDSH